MKWVGVLVAAALIAAAPALAQVTQDDVDAAREQIRLVNERLAEQVARYEEAVSEESQLQDRLDRLLVDLTNRERELVLARRAARDRAAEMYMNAGASPGSAAPGPELARLPTRYVYLESVSQTDRELVNRLEVARRDYEQQRNLVELAIADQAGLRAEMESLVAFIYGELEAANQAYQEVRAEFAAQEAERRRREEEERRRQEFLATSTTTTRPPPTTQATTTTTVAGGTTTTQGGTTTTTQGGTTTTTLPPVSGRVCPVDGATSFTDTWGAPRPGGRTHTGVDMLAAEGTPLVAIESGYISSAGYHSAGGNGLYIRADTGDTWYYAHLSSYVAGFSVGMRVAAGQRVGYVGHTGNASTPHLHLAWGPGGGSYQNPYPVVAAIC